MYLQCGKILSFLEDEIVAGKKSRFYVRCMIENLLPIICDRDEDFYKLLIFLRHVVVGSSY